MITAALIFAAIATGALVHRATRRRHVAPAPEVVEPDCQPGALWRETDTGYRARKLVEACKQKETELRAANLGSVAEFVRGEREALEVAITNSPGTVVNQGDGNTIIVQQTMVASPGGIQAKGNVQIGRGNRITIRSDSAANRAADRYHDALAQAQSVEAYRQLQSGLGSGRGLLERLFGGLGL